MSSARATTLTCRRSRRPSTQSIAWRRPLRPATPHAVGGAVRVARRVDDGYEVHAVEGAQRAGVVPAHVAEADQPGAQL